MEVPTTPTTPTTRTTRTTRRRCLQAGATLAATLALPLRAQGPAPELSAAQAQRDLRVLQRALTALHPGLYRRTSAESLDAAFARAQAEVAQGTSRGELVWQASLLAASVRCGHTWASRYNQRADVDALLFQRADKLPLTLRWAEGRALVTGSIAPGVMPGDELLAVDDTPVAQLAATLLPALRADGSHAGADGKRWAQLDSSATGGAVDRLLPLRQPPRDGRWQLRLRRAGLTSEVSVPAVLLASRDAALPLPADTWTLDVQGDTATLTLPTFAFWRGGFDWRAFIAQGFERIRDVPHLIIDQRRNEGGDDSVGRVILSHLLRAPHTVPAPRVESAYERVPYELARFLDTWDFGFFDRTGQVQKSAGRNWRLNEQPAPRRIEPVAQPYRGKTVLLVGAENSSAAFLFARDVQASGAATRIGRPTGGSRQGLNGGQLCWVTLPNSGVGVDVPLLASFFDDQPDTGVLPDVAVPLRFADIAAGIDADVRAAHAHLARNR